MRRRIIFALGVLMLAVMLVRHPSADVRVITHDIGDPAPRKVEAAVDMGLFALNLLVTWTAKGVALR
ncbi:hypothetical protein D1610_01775 [Sphingomonas gilva]|uniref:Uncharacterized protein n=1 Tax=Sphingomonas gilva TaxID=2305907 RepID=A0A396RQK8_9SPHN|nr:hypothetical protein [Sphingomonas gilva]RHW18897.1 hypothetical protein D1610_01775 [Sphingomonas gilva]